VVESAAIYGFGNGFDKRASWRNDASVSVMKTRRAARRDSARSRSFYQWPSGLESPLQSCVVGAKETPTFYLTRC